MSLPANISKVYFIGIGGIGMSALARYFLSRGAAVSGYDKTPTPITKQLENEGANIHFTDDTSLIDKQADLVIYTPAIPFGHSELNWFREKNYPVKKRSDVLSSITSDGFNICIAGTHGKTTMSVMTAFLLRETGYGCNAFLGGVSVNYDTNYWSGNNNVNVVEADEYDRSFLKLSPDIALVSAMDADHLDVYGDVEKMRQAFYEFAGKTKPNGLLITKYGLTFPDNSCKHIRYSVQNSSADVHGQNIKLAEGGYTFDVIGEGWSVSGLQLHMGGMHNVENAVASVAIAHYLNIDHQKIAGALKEFKGIKRRFEYVVNLKEARNFKHNVVYIDDYAHHPEELKSLLQGARSLFNNRWITVIFQPHLYSRTKDFAEAFATTLSIANRVILLPIYPARELPVEGVTSKMIADKMDSEKVSIMKKEACLKWLSTEYLNNTGKSGEGDVLITAGAGNIDQMIKPIKEIITGKQN